jgi:divalent metal cation (Fe/Co/Zn/Cd) transporter
MSSAHPNLVRRGFRLEYATLGWNAVGVVVLAVAALQARSVALVGFGLDSLIEIGASTVVIWELSDTGEMRRRPALRLISIAFLALSLYLTVQSASVLIQGHHPRHSPLGIVWTAATAAAMFTLAAAKTRTGRAVGNIVLQVEGRVTLVDGLLASAILVGLLLNVWMDWWWADPAASLVIVVYGIREGVAAFRQPAGVYDSNPRVGTQRR